MFASSCQGFSNAGRQSQIHQRNRDANAVWCESSRVLGVLKPLAFQKCFEEWIKSIASYKNDRELNQIAIDG
jgi:hypothetical protein